MCVGGVYLSNVHHYIIGLHVCRWCLPPWCLKLHHRATCVSVVFTSLMSIITSLGYMCVGGVYLPDVYHYIIGLHVCRWCYLHDVYHYIIGLHVFRWCLPPWCLSLHHRATCVSVVFTPPMSTFTSLSYMYIGVGHPHDVYHYVIGVHVCQCWLPLWCLS